MRVVWLVAVTLLAALPCARADELGDRIRKIVSHGPGPTAIVYLGRADVPAMPQIADPRREDRDDTRGTAGMIWQTTSLFVEVAVGGVRVHPSEPRRVQTVAGYVAWF
jgi:hypothetical protein